MGQGYASRGPSETENQERSAIAVPDADVGGLDAWGNGAVAEQIPSVAAPATGSGQTGAAPWWAGPEEAGAGGGEASAAIVPKGVREAFDAEMAEAKPDGETVFALLMQFGRPELVELRRSKASWSRIEVICGPERVQMILERLAVYDFALQDDPEVWYAIEQLRPLVKADIEAAVDRYLAEQLDPTVGLTQRAAGTGPRTRSVVLSPETRDRIGIGGTGEVTVRVFQPDIELEPTSQGIALTSVIIAPGAAVADVMMSRPMEPWTLKWSMSHVEVAPILGPLGKRDLTWY